MGSAEFWRFDELEEAPLRLLRWLLPATSILLAASCAPSPRWAHLHGGGVSARPSQVAQPPAFDSRTSWTGEASYYGRKFHGRSTASGERFNMRDMTAAHRTLPFGTKVRVTNLSNSKSVVVRINDRGPWDGHRIIDVSQAAAEKLGMIQAGTARVRVEVVK